MIRVPTTILLILAFIFFICVSTTVLLTLAYFYSSFLYVFRRRFCQRSLISILLFYMCSDDGSANARLSLFFFFICIPTTVLPTLAYLYPLFLYMFRRRFCQRSLISILFFYLCSGDGFTNARFYPLFLYVFRRRFCQCSLISILFFGTCSDDGSIHARISRFSFFICVPATVLSMLAYLYPLFWYVFRRRFCSRSLISIHFFYLCSGNGFVNPGLNLLFLYGF